MVGFIDKCSKHYFDLFWDVVATFIQLDKVGGIDTLAKTLPANVPWFSFTEGVGLKTIASWVITLVTVNLSLQSILQISLGAKDAATARKGLSGAVLSCFR